jgi:hypothetical protein
MLSEYSKSLEIEHEVVRRPLCPQIAIPLIGQCIVTAVHFDDIELTGVVLKAGFGRARRIRIETPGTDQCGISP